MTSYYPLFLDLDGQPCVVVGGGSVARRKVESLLACRARVRVISPLLCPELAELAAHGQVAHTARRYRAGDLAGAMLAVAATDDSETNQAVFAEASAKRMLVNVVDDPAHCNFIVPASFSRGELTVAISTGGASPALARRLRERLEAELGPEYGTLVTLVGEVRRTLKAGGRNPDGAAWAEALDLDALLALIRRGEVAEARRLLLQRLGGAA